MNKNTIILGVVGAIFAAAGLLWGHWETTPQGAEQGAAKHLLSQSLPDARGQMHDLSQWRDKTLVVNFWATWCAPCVEEMPELDELHAATAPTGTHVLGIGIDSADNIAQFAAKHKISYPLYIGGVGATEIARSLGNNAGGLPFTVLIGPDGRVRKSYLGRLKMEQLRRDLADL